MTSYKISVLLILCCYCFSLYFEKNSEASLLLLVFRCHLPWFYFSFNGEFMDKNDINKRTSDTVCSKVANHDQVSLRLRHERAFTEAVGYF